MVVQHSQNYNSDIKDKKGSKRVQNRSKNGKKLKMPIEIPFMSTIFVMFAQFIYIHLTIYRNLTPNITKGQKRVTNS